MKCPKCGAEIPDGTKFCGFCGCVVSGDDNPAHQVNYYGGFSQNISSANKVTNVSGQTAGAAGTDALTPEQMYRGIITGAIVASVFGVVGLIVSLNTLSVNPNDDSFSILFVISLLASFAGLFTVLLTYLIMQPRLFKIKPPSSLKDWIPTGLAIVALGVVIPAVVFAIQVFIKLIES